MFKEILKTIALIITTVYVVLVSAFAGYLYSFKANELSKSFEDGVTQSSANLQQLIVNQVKTNGFLPITIDDKTINLVPETNLK